MNRICPFNHRSCAECTFYRGRHCFTDFRHGNGRQRKNSAEMPDFNSIPLLTFRRNGTAAEKRKKAEGSRRQPQMKLKIIDLITEETIFADMEEARGWQWNDPEVQRFINGCVHVTSWHEMEEYCLRRAAKGDSEVVIYQSPGYLMISGG